VHLEKQEENVTFIFLFSISPGKSERRTLHHRNKEQKQYTTKYPSNPFLITCNWTRKVCPWARVHPKKTILLPGNIAFLSRNSLLFFYSFTRIFPTLVSFFLPFPFQFFSSIFLTYFTSLAFLASLFSPSYLSFFQTDKILKRGKQLHQNTPVLISAYAKSQNWVVHKPPS